MVSFPMAKPKIAYEFKLTRVREVGLVSEADSPERVVDYWRNNIEKADWYSETKEHLVVLLLNTRLKAIGHALVSIGTLNECVAHPRDIFAPVLTGGAYGFILIHNHPSGDPSPSEADRQLTRRVNDGSDIFQVKCFDHIVIGNPNYFSFREHGFL